MNIWRKTPFVLSMAAMFSLSQPLNVFAAENVKEAERQIPPSGYVPPIGGVSTGALGSTYDPYEILDMLDGTDLQTEDGFEEEALFTAAPDTDTSGLPSAYPADPLYYINNVLPPVRNQNPYGNCWAQAATALLEIYKEHEGSTINRDVDYSEAHLVHYTYSDGSNPNVSGSDGRFYTDPAISETDKNNLGGSTIDAARTLLRWRGAVKADKLGITGDNMDSYTWDADIESSMDDIHLREYYIIDIEHNPDIAKAWIKEHGAVGIAYNSAGVKEGTYNDLSGIDSFYCPTHVETNHAVAIVGWDDDYPASNFKANPGSNGAWLVRNSWGEGYGSVSDPDYYSYFWLSYKDKSMTDFAVAFVPETADDAPEYRYYYDSQTASDYTIYSNAAADTYSANIFKNQSNEEETLKYVDFEYNMPEEKNAAGDATVYIYTGVTGYPDTGSLAMEKDVQLPFTGHYSIDVPDGVKIAAGSYFSVVVKMHGEFVPIECGFRDYEALPIDDATGRSAIRHSEPSISAGESFVKGYYGNEWYDLYKDYDNNIDKNGNLIIGAVTTQQADGRISIASGTSAKIADGEDLAYDTREKTPALTLKRGSTVLTPETDYTVTYSNNVFPGTAEAVVTGIGKYRGVIKVPFTIEPFELNNSNSYIDIGREEYSILEMDDFLGVRPDKVELHVHFPYMNDGEYIVIPNSDYERRANNWRVQYMDNDRAGTMTVVINGVHDYEANSPFSGEVTKMATIKGETASGLYWDPVYEPFYSGHPYYPEFVLYDKDGNRLENTEDTSKPGYHYLVNHNEDSEDYDPDALYNYDEGDNFIYVYVHAPYNEQFTVMYKIFPVPVDDPSVSISLPPTTYYADGEEKRPFPSFKFNGEEVIDYWYDVSYSNNISEGTATCIVEGRYNFTGTASLPFTILPPLKTDISTLRFGTSSTQTVENTYNSSELTPMFTLSDGDYLLVDGRDFDAVFSDNVNVGTAKITITGKGNTYEGTRTETFTIYPKAIGSVDCTVDGVIGGDRFEYTGAPAEPKVTVTQSYQVSYIKAGMWERTIENKTRTLEEGTDYTLSYTNNDLDKYGYGRDELTAYIAVEGTGNYTGSVSVPFTIYRNGTSKPPAATDTRGKTDTGITPVTIDGVSYDVSIRTVFDKEIVYTGGKISPANYLGAETLLSGLYDLAEAAVTNGDGDVELLFKYKYIASGNKNAGTAKFYPKITFNSSKARGKKYKMSKANAKTINNAVKAINKAAKASPAEFTITPVDINEMFYQAKASFTKKAKPKITWIKLRYGGKIRKLAKSSFKVDAYDVDAGTITVIGKGRNFTGSKIIDVD